jgi:hypothetical protein
VALAAVALALLAWTAACGDGTREYVGTLQGREDLATGCAWLLVGQEAYDPDWPDGYRVLFSPPRLIGPGGEVVAEEGQRVRVRGTTAERRVSNCQLGPVLTVSEVLGTVE